MSDKPALDLDEAMRRAGEAVFNRDWPDHSWELQGAEIQNSFIGDAAAALASLAASGWVLVPSEVTDEMYAAGRRVINAQDYPPCATDIFDEMVNAAPKVKP